VEILEESERLAKEAEAEGGAEKSRDEEKVPEELKLVYKDDLKGKGPAAPAQHERPHSTLPAADGTGAVATTPAAMTLPVSQAVQIAPPAAPRPAPAQPVRQQQQPPPAAQPQNGHPDDIQLDAAIWVVSGLLIILISRMLVKMLS
jgi:hypothetical protein